MIVDKCNIYGSCDARHRFFDMLGQHSTGKADLIPLIDMFCERRSQIEQRY